MRDNSLNSMDHMIDGYRLNTPEAVSVTYDIAGIGTRFLAAAIDYAISFVLLIAIVVGVLALYGIPGGSETTALILGATAVFILFFGYFAIFETLWNGQTPGKRLLRIRVIKTSGYPIGFLDSAIRNLVRVIDLLPGLYGVGVLTMFISSTSRRLGDYAAGTIVVKERRFDVADLVPTAPSPVPATEPARGALDSEELEWDLEALSAQDLRMIGEFIRRAPTLTPVARRSVGDEIAQHISARIGARLPHDPVRFLGRVTRLQSMSDDGHS